MRSRSRSYYDIFGKSTYTTQRSALGYWMMALGAIDEALVLLVQSPKLVSFSTASTSSCLIPVVQMILLRKVSVFSPVQVKTKAMLESNRDSKAL